MPVEAIKEWWTKEKKKWTEAPPEPVDPSVTAPESEMGVGHHIYLDGGRLALSSGHSGSSSAWDSSC